MKPLSILLLPLFALLLSCGNSKEQTETHRKLKGKWSGVEVTVNGEPQQGFVVGFNFDTDTSYSYRGGAYEEKGSYYLDGNKLYTQAEGDLEKKVEIAKITDDSLFLNMNQAGADMRMILVREE